METGRQRSSIELDVIEKVRRITSRLPAVHEVVDGFGHLAFKVGKKSFAIMGTELHLAIKADPTSQHWLIRSGRFRRTPYIGQHGWVSVADFADADWEEIGELLEDAFEMVAPKRVLKQRQTDAE